jgi:hypothetical protein
MALFSKVLLSGSTNGKGILITGTTSGSATTIHTACSGTANMDEIWIYLVNQEATEEILTTVQFGSDATADEIAVSVPAAAGLQFVVPGLVLNNSNIVKAFAATGSKVVAHGFVNRITE